MSTVTITLAGVNAAVIEDIQAYWMAQLIAPAGTIGAAMDAATPTLTIPFTPRAAASEITAAGQTILIDQEPMLITAITSTGIAVARGSFGPLAAHAEGAVVTLLEFASSGAMLVSVLQRWFRDTALPKLGFNSAVLAATAAISVQ